MSRSSEYQKYYKFCRDALDDRIQQKGFVVFAAYKDDDEDECFGGPKLTLYYCDQHDPSCRLTPSYRLEPKFTHR